MDRAELSLALGAVHYLSLPLSFDSGQNFLVLGDYRNIQNIKQDLGVRTIKSMGTKETAGQEKPRIPHSLPPLKGNMTW